MAIGERIRFIRNLRGFTQKFLGKAVGFPEKTADIRLAQYEAGTRTPKADLSAKLASVLQVRPEALDVPNIDTYVGLAHTLFALEDIHGFKIEQINGQNVLTLNKNTASATNLEFFSAWSELSKKYANGEISKEDYDKWRYNYPESATR